MKSNNNYLSKEEAEKTGLPLYENYDEVPEGLYPKWKCLKMRKPVKANSKPAAYVYNRLYKGYVPLYKRKPV